MKGTAIALGLGIAALGAAGLQGRSETSAPAAAAALPVESAAVRLEPGYEVQEIHTGRVVARRASALGFERAGLLARVLADDGARVEAGQRLAVLDTRQLEAERKRMAAQVADVEAQLAMASLTAKRTRRLRDADHVSPARLDEVLYAERALEARRAAARAGLESVEAALALSEIRAPYAGQVVAREVDEGTVVSPGQAILRLIEDGALEARLGLPPAAAAGLAPGARLSLDVDGRPVPGVLVAVVGAVERDTRTVTAVVALEPGAGEPRPRDGAVARVTLPRRLEGAGFWLPLAALAESHRGLWSAYALVAEPDEPTLRRVERRTLEVLHAEGERAFVRGPLRDGEQVAASGVHRLVPGQRVRAVAPAGASDAAAPQR
jgi:RND family efflux transporter MFP subunit